MTGVDVHSKYRFWEARLTQQSRTLRDKTVEINKTLEALFVLQNKKVRLGLNVSNNAQGNDDAAKGIQYEISEQIYGSAKLSDQRTVCLWLGVGDDDDGVL